MSVNLSHDLEELAKVVAAAKSLSVEQAIRQALEESVRALGVTEYRAPRRRMTVEEMLNVGKEFAAMPVLDPRSPHEIMEELNEQIMIDNNIL